MAAADDVVPENLILPQDFNDTKQGILDARAARGWSTPDPLADVGQGETITAEEMNLLIAATRVTHGIAYSSAFPSYNLAPADKILAVHMNQVKQAYKDIRDNLRCTPDCYGSCYSACSATCGLTCSTKACSSSGCSGVCSTGCGNYCTSCSGSIALACVSNCGFSCSGTGSCKGSCSTRCVGTCSTMCINTCTGGCSGSCNQNCSLTCNLSAIISTGRMPGSSITGVPNS